MITISNLCKKFDENVVLDNISVSFEQGKCNLIIGKSGAGKTVLLKCLIGVLTPTQGHIYFDQTDMSTLTPKRLKRFRTRMGVMFQNSALFDSMNVFENVLFPLQMFSKLSNSEKKKRVCELLERVGLLEAGRLSISEISGGMTKRAALARALALDPEYLFCDEPNSGLDPQTSQTIDKLIYEITHENNITTVINTHDMNSVRNIGDTILFLNQGKAEWIGTMHQIDEPEADPLRKFISQARSL